MPASLPVPFGLGNLSSPRRTASHRRVGPRSLPSSAASPSPTSLLESAPPLPTPPRRQWPPGTAAGLSTPRLPATLTRG
eukprot:3159373-Alexandrium_andersonii.AAC.1